MYFGLTRLTLIKVSVWDCCFILMFHSPEIIVGLIGMLLFGFICLAITIQALGFISCALLFSKVQVNSVSLDIISPLDLSINFIGSPFFAKNSMMLSQTS